MYIAPLRLSFPNIPQWIQQNGIFWTGIVIYFAICVIVLIQIENIKIPLNNKSKSVHHLKTCKMWRNGVIKSVPVKEPKTSLVRGVTVWRTGRWQTWWCSGWRRIPQGTWKHVSRYNCSLFHCLDSGCRSRNASHRFYRHVMTEGERRRDAEGGLLLLYEAIPVLLYKIPGKQVTSEAAWHPVDDQRQLLGLDDVTLQTCG